MSNNNNEVGVFLFIIAMIGMVGLVIVAFVAALLILATIFATIVAIFAWNHEIELWGETITPQEARTYIGRGLLGAIVAPLTSIIIFAFIPSEVDQDYWVYIVLLGYVVFSTGIEALIAMEQEEARKRTAASPVILPPAMPAPAPTTTYRPLLDQSRGLSAPIVQPDPVPFRYASWDDEEIRS